MKTTNNTKVLLILPEPLLEVTDEAAQGLHMSRLAFIREAITRRVCEYRQHEKPQLDDLFGGSDFVREEGEKIGGDFWVED